MEPYKKFANPRYARMFNYFLKNVVEPKFKKKYHKDIKLKLYGIGITPKSPVYEAIPKEELLDSQATVSFFIDTEPSHLRTNFIEDLILVDGRAFLQLQNGDYLGYEPEKFRIRINFNNRALYPLSYIDEEPIEENRIKTKLLKESKIVETRYGKKTDTNFLFRRVKKEELDNEFKLTYEFYSDFWKDLIKIRDKTFNQFKKAFITTIIDKIHRKLIDGFLDDGSGKLYNNVMEIIDDMYGDRIAKLWSQKTGKSI